MPSKAHQLSRFRTILKSLVGRKKKPQRQENNPPSQTEIEYILARIDNKLPSGTKPPDWGKESFLRTMPANARILDVGCGNNSPQLTKQILPECYYVGVDVGDYNQDNPHCADEYITTPPEQFSNKIFEYNDQFDAVVSSHNIEHCNEPDKVLIAMLQAIKDNGMLYLACPSADSARYPSRDGTLNYLDDPTHKGSPPDFGQLISTIVAHEFDIIYASSRYQPAVRWLIGLYHEAQSAESKKIDTETWAFWGFETIIWARKRTRSSR
jgi:2-polyprenyl-3-methyl-5-hydroxy-6-metoxy-1,4-benzoquinol methylase